MQGGKKIRDLAKIHFHCLDDLFRTDRATKQAAQMHLATSNSLKPPRSSPTANLPTYQHTNSNRNKANDNDRGYRIEVCQASSVALRESPFFLPYLLEPHSGALRYSQNTALRSQNTYKISKKDGF
jgi:hypothetical protein